MLGKVIKYDLLENFKLLLPFAAVLLILSGAYSLYITHTYAGTEAAQVMFSDTEEAEESEVSVGTDAVSVTVTESDTTDDTERATEEESDVSAPVLVMVLGFMAVGMLITVMSALSIVFPVIQYTKSMFRDRGYLTNVLPMSTPVLIAAKSLSALITFAFGELIAFLSGGMIAWAISSVTATETKQGVKALIAYVFSEVSNATATGMVVEAIVSVLLTMGGFIIMLQFCISVGSSFTKFQTLITAACVVVSMIVKGKVLDLLSIDSMLDVLSEKGELPISSELAQTAMTSGLYYIIAAIVMIAVFYLGTIYFVKNRLNLE